MVSVSPSLGLHGLTESIANLKPYREVDIAFFVAMVELWSSDGTENRTMVADPSAVASALATQPTYTRRRRRAIANAPGGHTVVSGSVLDTTLASGSNAHWLQGDPAYVCPLVSPLSRHLAHP